MKRQLAILLIAAALLGFIFPGSSARAAEVAPDFSLVDTNNNLVSSSGYKGKQAVLLLFWTIECPLCRGQLKLVNEKFTELSQKGLVILSVNAGNSASRVKAFAKNYGLKYTVLLDEYFKVATDYGVFGVPTYILINKHGDIVYRYYSFPTERQQAEALK